MSGSGGRDIAEALGGLAQGISLQLQRNQQLEVARAQNVSLEDKLTLARFEATARLKSQTQSEAAAQRGFETQAASREKTAGISAAGTVKAAETRAEGALTVQEFLADIRQEEEVRAEKRQVRFERRAGVIEQRSIRRKSRAEVITNKAITESKKNADIAVNDARATKEHELRTIEEKRRVENEIRVRIMASDLRKAEVASEVIVATLAQRLGIPLDENNNILLDQVSQDVQDEFTATLQAKADAPRVKALQEAARGVNTGDPESAARVFQAANPPLNATEQELIAAKKKKLQEDRALRGTGGTQTGTAIKSTIERAQNSPSLLAANLTTQPRANAPDFQAEFGDFLDGRMKPNVKYFTPAGPGKEFSINLTRNGVNLLRDMNVATEGRFMWNPNGSSGIQIGFEVDVIPDALQGSLSSSLLNSLNNSRAEFSKDYRTAVDALREYRKLRTGGKDVKRGLLQRIFKEWDLSLPPNMRTMEWTPQRVNDARMVWAILDIARKQTKFGPVISADQASDALRDFFDNKRWTQLHVTAGLGERTE